MIINAYIADGTWLKLDNGVEFKIPHKLVYKLRERGIKITYKYKK